MSNETASQSKRTGGAKAATKWNVFRARETESGQTLRGELLGTVEAWQESWALVKAARRFHVRKVNLIVERVAAEVRS